MSQANPIARPPSRWPFFILGLVCFILGPAIYAFQVGYQKQLVMPWYVGGLATFGVLLMAISFFQHKGILRGIGLALFLAICGLEWAMLTVFIATPAYTGPAIPGQKVPAFAGALADGQTFSQADVSRGQPTILLFSADTGEVCAWLS